MILANVDVKEPATVKLRLNGKVAGGAKLWKVEGNGPHGNNELEKAQPQVFLRQEKLDAFSDGHTLALAPAMLVAIRWQEAQPRVDSSHATSDFQGLLPDSEERRSNDDPCSGAVSELRR